MVASALGIVPSTKSNLLCGSFAERSAAEIWRGFNACLKSVVSRIYRTRFALVFRRTVSSESERGLSPIIIWMSWYVKVNARARRPFVARQIMAAAGKLLVVLLSAITMFVLSCSTFAQTPPPAWQSGDLTRGYGVTLLTHGWTPDGVLGAIYNVPWLTESALLIRRERTVQNSQGVLEPPKLFYVYVEPTSQPGLVRRISIF